MEQEDFNGIEKATATKLRLILDKDLSGEIEEGAEERVTFEFANGSLPEENISQPKIPTN